METPITELRNLMGPLVNYFAIMMEPNYFDAQVRLIQNEKRMAIKNLPRIREILAQIPDDACSPRYEDPLLTALKMIAYGIPVPVSGEQEMKDAAITALEAYNYRIKTDSNYEPLHHRV